MSKLSASLAIIVLLLTTSCLGSSGVEAEVESDAVSPSIEIGSCNPLFDHDGSDKDAIGHVLHGEGTLVVSQDIENLMSLWTSDSFIADAKNSPNDNADDQRWQGKDAIRHRYVRIVFPGAPAVAKPSNLDITVEESEAVVMATTNIGDEISPFGDEWRLINEDGCWTIKSLTYNLEEK